MLSCITHLSHSYVQDIALLLKTPIMGLIKMKYRSNCYTRIESTCLI